jgi:hypothetical protein
VSYVSTPYGRGGSGARFVYADRAEREIVAVARPLGPEDLAELSPDWIARVRNTAKQGRSQDLLDLARQIRPEHADVSDAIDQMVRGYRFARIVELTDKRKGNDA